MGGETQNKRTSSRMSFYFGTAEGIRTPDLLVRSQSLYPAELQPHFRPARDKTPGGSIILPQNGAKSKHNFSPSTEICISQICISQKEGQQKAPISASKNTTPRPSTVTGGLLLILNLYQIALPHTFYEFLTRQIIQNA